MLKSMQRTNVPGFKMKEPPQKQRDTRLGVRLQAARYDGHGSDSDATSRVHSARTAGSLEAPLAEPEDDARDKSWLEQEKDRAALRAAAEERESKILTRKLNLKLSKYKMEIHEANKILTSLVTSSQEALRDAPDLTDLTIGLADGLAGRVRISSARGKRESEPATDIDNPAPHGEDGLLGTVRMLTEATIKIALRKKRLEEVVGALRKEYVREKKRFEDNLCELEEKMKSLRKAKENAEFSLQDTRLSFEGQIKSLEREAQEAREKLQVLELVNNQLSSTVRTQEEELLEVPRLEETYLRKARGIVQHKEKEVQEKTIALRKVEREVENGEFWHGKAKALDAEGQAKDRRIAELNRQLHQLHHKYINAERLREREREIERRSKKMPNGVEDRGLEKEEQTHGELREASPQAHANPLVPTTRSSPSSPTVAQKPASRSGKRGEADLGFELGQTSHVDLKLPLEIEVQRLKRDNAELHRKLERANMALSSARAYPLFNLGLDSGCDGGGDEDSNGGEIRNGKKGEQEILDELFDSDEDKEALSRLSAEELELIEKERQADSSRRIERALTVSAAYKAKLLQLRDARPGAQYLRNLRRK